MMKMKQLMKNIQHKLHRFQRKCLLNSLKNSKLKRDLTMRPQKANSKLVQILIAQVVNIEYYPIQTAISKIINSNCRMMKTKSTMKVASTYLRKVIITLSYHHTIKYFFRGVLVWIGPKLVTRFILLQPNKSTEEHWVRNEAMKLI